MMGDMLIYGADTGILKAVMDAEYITTLRTGAVAAHSALLFGDYSGAPEPVNPIFRATLSAWQSHSE